MSRHLLSDDELKTIAKRLHEASTKPWKIDTAFDGENWLLASLGNSNVDGLDYHITTDHVHASEYDGDAKDDAEFIVWCRNDMARIGNAYVALREINADLLAACIAMMKAFETHDFLPGMYWPETDAMLKAMAKARGDA